MSAAPALQIENLWKKYGFRCALSGASLELPAGECLAIFGPNGAGKSTLLNILATRVKPTSGEVSVFGHDLAGEAQAARSDIGVVFHESGLRGDLSLDENLRFFAGLYGRPGLTESSVALIEALGLGERRREPVRNFSRGMTQRATIIRSLAHDPRLWLLDEPFSGLDPSGRELFAEVIRREHASGRTVVFITHDIGLGLALATRSLVIETGDIVAREADEVRAYFAGRSAAGEAVGT